MSPKDVYVLIPRTCECGKGQLTLQMKLRLLITWLLERESSLDYPVGPNLITRVLKAEEGSERKTSVRVMPPENTQPAIAVLKMEGGHEPRNAGRLDGKAGKMQPPLEPPGGMQLYQLFDFSLVRPTSDCDL